MPNSKGGAEARKRARNKDERRKNINRKKNEKMKKRIALIKARGNLCEISPVQIASLKVVDEKTFMEEKMTYSTPAEVSLYAAILSECIGKVCQIYPAIF